MHINNALENLGRYFAKHRLNLNIDKTEFIVFHRKGKYEPTILFPSDPKLKAKSHVKYLGVTFDETMSYTLEVNKIVSKMACGIKCIQNIEHFLPLNSRIILLKALVLSHINYSAILLTGITNQQCMLINRQISRAIKTCTNEPSRTSTSSLLRKFDLLPADLLIKLKCSEYLWKIENKNKKSFEKLKFPYVLKRNVRTGNINTNLRVKTHYAQRCYMKRTTSLQNRIPRYIWSETKPVVFKRDMHAFVFSIFRNRPPDRRIGAPWLEDNWI